MSNLVQYRVGKHNFVFGLSWHKLVITEPLGKQINEHAAKANTSLGVVAGNKKLNPCVGLVDDTSKIKGHSAAGSLLPYLDNVIFVIPFSYFDETDERYWILAIQDGAIIAGSDVIRSEEEAVTLVKRFKRIGSFQLLGQAEFYQKHFKELKADQDYYTQTYEDLVITLTRKPVRITNVTTAARKRALIFLAIVATVAIGFIVYKSVQKLPEIPKTVRIDKVAEWRKSLPVIRRNMVNQANNVLGFYAPDVFVAAVLEHVGKMKPFVDDWHISEIRCDEQALGAQCRITWRNEGLSDNQKLRDGLGEDKQLSFTPKGNLAYQTIRVTISGRREKITEQFLVDLIKEQDFLLEHGSLLQQLASVEMRVRMHQPSQSQQIPPSPNGEPYTGPDTTFHYGKYTVQGKPYFLIADTPKRLAVNRFSVKTLTIKFDKQQNCLGWQLEGHYVWK